MTLGRIKLSAGHQKFGILLAIIIAGAFAVSWGFHHIQNNQHNIEGQAHQLQGLVDLKESQKAACLQANILRANTNVNALAQYQAWISVSHLPGARSYVQASLRSVLQQTWIPLTDCRIPPVGGIEGYPIPSAVKFAVRMPPQAALMVPPTTR